MAMQLSRATRKNLRRKFRAADDASPPLALEVWTDAEQIIDEIYPLYLAVAQTSAIRFEVFTREYFLEAGRCAPGKFRYFIWRQGHRAVAFSFCTIWNGTLYDNDIGLDYTVAYELNLYYVTFRDLLNWALANGLRRYASAPFSYDPKLRLRLQLQPVDVYVKHISPWLNPLIKILALLFRTGAHRSSVAAPASPSPMIQKTKKLLLNPWFQLVLSVLFVTTSEVFLKRGAVEAPRLPEEVNWTGVSGLASPDVWYGILFVIASFISWLYVLRFIPLTIAYPLSNVVHVLVPLASWFFLNEHISIQRWCGIALVLLGVLIVAKPVARMEENL